MRVLPERGADCYPLSPLQQGMLYHSLDAGATGVDVEQITCELREAIEPGKFRAAWDQVAARHEILRTGFYLGGGEPSQVVHPPGAPLLEFHYEELGGEHALRTRLNAYLAEDRARGFPDLRLPPIRVALLRGAGNHFWFVTTFHHLLLDGRALVVMFKEVMDLHDALIAGVALRLPEPRPYRGYIDWLQARNPETAETFWREYWRGFTTPTLLPLARPPAVDPAQTRGELAFRLPTAETARLREAAGRHGVTLNTLAQAAWALVLGRYTGEADVVFGAVRACRHVPVDGAAAIVGLFINTVPVRVRVDAGASLGPWLRSLREQWVALRDHEHTPLMMLQQWTEVAPGRPLFETLFNYQEPSWDTALRLLGGKWEHRHFDIISQPNYPLAVDAYGGDHIIVKVLYDRRRFADDAIHRLLGHYRVVLEALEQAGERSLAAVPMLTRRERETFAAWNRTETAYPRNVCVHEQVAAHARAHPRRIAVADGATTLTYGELETRAEALASRLTAHGVGPERIVAVCLDRSVEMIVAWLAVLKAGGAFCPLDPGYPAERLAFMLADSGATVVLTRQSLTRALPASSVVIVDVDAVNEDRFSPVSDGNRVGARVRAKSNDLAYVIYTSGSTGRPKGVQIEHRALMNLVTWHQRAFAVTPRDRAMQVASPAFDASVWEIWPYLSAGASIHIPDEDTRVSPARLWRWLEASRITIAFLPTPIAEAAMSEAWPAGLVLRTILTGGDKLKRPAPGGFPAVLVNNYGPTESTVVATSGVVAPGAESPLPTIGRPIANTRVHVLDRWLRPVPVGVPGELCIGGQGLARGYLGRPELTAEKFVTLPDSPDLPIAEGASDREAEARRVYRTGDLVRWAETGELEFLGRMDGQVKIRGCRIELGEIEAILQRHPLGRESVVLVRTDERHQPQLVAYVRAGAIAREDGAAGGSRNDEREITTYLRETLPAYMVPTALVFLDRWPLTPNGKIDREALPAPVSRSGEQVGADVPSTPTEQTVARVWCEILGRERIGCQENFFDLGGHSLLAAQVVSRLNQALSASLSVRAVFDQPTIRGLARELDARGRQAPAIPRITSSPRKRRIRPDELLQPN